MSYHLAQLNVATAKGPMDSEVMAEFAAALDEVNALAEASDGFVWRLQDESGNATGIETAGDDPLRIINLSVWESVEALKAFTYSLEHADFLRRRLDWFEERDGPHFAMWWVPAGHEPTVDEAEDRLARLRHDGPSAAAFTFAHRFPPPE